MILTGDSTSDIKMGIEILRKYGYSYFDSEWMVLRAVKELEVVIYDNDDLETELEAVDFEVDSESYSRPRELMSNRGDLRNTVELPTYGVSSTLGYES